MTVTRNREGSIIISEMVTDSLGNEFYTDRVFQGYSINEATERFEQYLKEEGLKVSK